MRLPQLLILPLPWALRRAVLEALDLELARARRSAVRSFSREKRCWARAVIGSLTVVSRGAGTGRGGTARQPQLGHRSTVEDEFFRHLPERSEPGCRAPRGRYARHLIDCTAACVSAHSRPSPGGIRNRQPQLRFPRRPAGRTAYYGRHARLRRTRCILPRAAAPGSLGPRRRVGLRSERQRTLGLYRGNPAQRVGEMPADLGYFQRDTGFIAERALCCEIQRRHDFLQPGAPCLRRWTPCCRKRSRARIHRLRSRFGGWQPRRHRRLRRSAHRSRVRTR